MRVAGEDAAGKGIANQKLCTNGTHKANAMDVIQTEDTCQAIPDVLRVALLALTRGHTAAIRVDRAASVLGTSADEAARMLADLQEADLAEVWEQGPGGRPCVVLTPRGAALLGLEMSDRRKAGFNLFWAARGKGDDPGPRLAIALAETDVTEPDRPGLLDMLPDPHAVDPGEAVAEDDHLSDPARRKATVRAVASGTVNPPRPTVILGITAQWPIERPPGTPCPVCRGLPLGRLVYCAADGCERSGLDFMLPRVPACVRPKASRSKADEPTARGKPKLGGGKGPAGEARDVPIPQRKKRTGSYTPPARDSFNLKAL